MSRSASKIELTEQERIELENIVDCLRSETRAKAPPLRRLPIAAADALTARHVRRRTFAKRPGCFGFYGRARTMVNNGFSGAAFGNLSGRGIQAGHTVLCAASRRLFGNVARVGNTQNR